VQEVDAGPPSRRRQQRLLREHASDTAPRVHRHAHDLGAFELFRERRIGLAAGEDRQAQTLLKKGRGEPAQVGLATPGFPGNEVERVQPDVQRYRP
jgi:hypothetical protein